MGFFDKFGTGEGWLARTFGGKQSMPTTPANPNPNPVDATMDNYNQTNSAFTQPNQGNEPFVPNLGLQTEPPTTVNPNTMDTTGTQVNPYSMEALLSDETFNKWGTSAEDLNTFMNKIAYHESGGSMDPTQQQWSGGPGRGLFQYEQTFKDEKTGEYGQAGGMTARNRLANYYTSKNMKIPDWLIQEGMNDPTIGFDASKLTDEQQRMLFLADKRYNPNEGSGLTQENIADVGSYWGQHHWAGAEVGSDDYIHEQEKFASSLDAYNQSQNAITGF
tara:strand:+ start:3213 stop:4037 length:825 start_codon:yes stop_codon:yes gene_type:complete